MSRTERASGTGSGRSKTEFTTAKVAVFAAIQTAKVRTPVTVNPLSPKSERTACRRLRKANPIVANTQSGRADVARTLAEFTARSGPPGGGKASGPEEAPGKPSAVSGRPTRHYLPVKRTLC